RRACRRDEAGAAEEGNAAGHFVGFCTEIAPSLISLPDRRPRVVWIVRRSRLRELLGLVAEVLLIDDALGTNDEGHDTARPVLRRVREEREAAGHLAVLEIAAGAAGGMGALRGQVSIEV